MNVSFILNGEDVEVETPGDNRLAGILRLSFGLLGTKTDCCIGNCGVCSVLLNGEVVKSCLVPAFMIQGSEVITIEGFSQTDEYQDIVTGFSEAGMEICRSCNTGKILAAEALLSRNMRPSREKILSAFQGVKCRCMEPEELIQGLMKVSELRRRRLYVRSR